MKKKAGADFALPLAIDTYSLKVTNISGDYIEKTHRYAKRRYT